MLALPRGGGASGITCFPPPGNCCGRVFIIVLISHETIEAREAGLHGQGGQPALQGL